MGQLFLIKSLHRKLYLGKITYEISTVAWKYSLNVHRDMPGNTVVIKDHQGYSESAWTSKSMSRKNGFLDGPPQPSPSMSARTAFGSACPWWAWLRSSESSRLPAVLPPAGLCLFFMGFTVFLPKMSSSVSTCLFCYSLLLNSSFKQLLKKIKRAHDFTRINTLNLYQAHKHICPSLSNFYSLSSTHITKKIISG